MFIQLFRPLDVGSFVRWTFPLSKEIEAFQWRCSFFSLSLHSLHSTLGHVEERLASILMDHLMTYLFLPADANPVLALTG